MPKKFAMLVGNGFTLDFSVPFGLHSSFPLKNFNSHEIKFDNDFMDHLPHIKSKLLGRDLNDFEAIKKYVNLFKDIEEDYHLQTKSGNYEIVGDPKYDLATKEHIELRRFLAMAYSVFQLQIEKYDMSNWKWINWLKNHHSNLLFAISFNYDLVFETALQLAGASFYRVGTGESHAYLDRMRTPLIKPHGSIDFDLPNHFISGNFDPWQISATLNDAQFVQVVPKTKWLLPRLEADIISPSLHNIQYHLSWVSKMFTLYQVMSKQLDSLVIIGCSYWDVDRPEIDFFLRHLNRRTKIYVIDPFPSLELKKKIQSFGLSYREANSLGLPW